MNYSKNTVQGSSRKISSKSTFSKRNVQQVYRISSPTQSYLLEAGDDFHSSIKVANVPGGKGDTEYAGQNSPAGIVCGLGDYQLGHPRADLSQQRDSIIT